MRIFLISALILTPAFAQAITNCDDQAKPALECPTGYTMMCNPTGGDHWSCGKESRDGIIEWSPDAEGVKQTIQTQVQTAPAETHSDCSEFECPNPEAERQTPKRDFGDRMRGFFSGIGSGFKAVGRWIYDTAKSIIQNIRA